MSSSKKICPNCEKGQAKPVPVRLTLTHDLPAPLVVSNLLGMGCDLCGCVFIHFGQARHNEKKIKKARAKLLKEKSPPSPTPKKPHFKKGLNINTKKAKKAWELACEQKDIEGLKRQWELLPPPKQLKGSLFEGFLLGHILPKLLWWWEDTWTNPSSLEEETLREILGSEVFIHHLCIKNNPKYIYNLLEGPKTFQLLKRLLSHPKCHYPVLLQFGIIKNDPQFLKHVLDNATQVSPSLSHQLVVSGLGFVSKEMITEPVHACACLVEYLNLLSSKHFIHQDQTPLLLEAVSFGKKSLVASLLTQNPSLKLSESDFNHTAYSFRHSRQSGNTNRCDGIVASLLLLLPNMPSDKTAHSLQKHPHFFDALCQKAPQDLVKKWSFACSLDNAHLPQEIQNFHLRAQLEKAVLSSSSPSPPKKM